MAAFRILDQSPVYFLLDGVTPAAGGRIEFYEAGTTTAKDVYGDKALSVNNGSSVALGSDGRAAVDVWGSGSYRVRVYAADDTIISDDDNVELPGGDGATIPALESGKVLSNDGAVLEWLDILQPPDPTGQSGKVIGSDGGAFVWQDPPASPTLPTLPAGGITATSGKVTIGAILIQWGTGTASPSGGREAAATITFPTAYSATPYVDVSRGGPMVSSGLQGTSGVSSAGTTSFNAHFDVNVSTTAAGYSPISSDIPFSWFAIGPA